MKYNDKINNFLSFYDNLIEISMIRFLVYINVSIVTKNLIIKKYAKSTHCYFHLGRTWFRKRNSMSTLSGSVQIPSSVRRRSLKSLKEKIRLREWSTYSEVH